MNPQPILWHSKPEDFFDKQDWQQDVARGDTHMGYADWVAYNQSTDHHDPDWLEELWTQFADIPVDSDDHLEEGFYIWEPGTPKLTIWHWFDSHYPKGIVYLVHEHNPL